MKAIGLNRSPKDITELTGVYELGNRVVRHVSPYSLQRKRDFSGRSDNQVSVSSIESLRYLPLDLTSKELINTTFYFVLLDRRTL